MNRGESAIERVALGQEVLNQFPLERAAALSAGLGNAENLLDPTNARFVLALNLGNPPFHAVGFADPNAAGAKDDIHARRAGSRSHNNSDDTIAASPINLIRARMDARRIGRRQER